MSTIGIDYDIELDDWFLYQEDDLYNPRNGILGVIKEGVHKSGFPLGTRIITSPIMKVDTENRIVTTRSGTRYKLGKVDEGWEKEYPNAEERFFKRAKEILGGE